MYSGIERLCMCTTSGKLKFYQVSQHGSEESLVQAKDLVKKDEIPNDFIDHKRGLATELLEGSPGKVFAGNILF